MKLDKGVIYVLTTNDGKELFYPTVDVPDSEDHSGIEAKRIAKMVNGRATPNFDGIYDDGAKHGGRIQDSCVFTLGPADDNAVGEFFRAMQGGREIVIELLDDLQEFEGQRMLPAELARLERIGAEVYNKV